MKSPALLDQNKIVSIPVYLGITTSGASNEYLTSDCGVRKTEGGAYTFKAHADSTGAATLGVYGSASAPIKKANGSDASIKAGGIYTVRYSAPNFILQGEGASGNAVASDLRSGKTATTDAGDITGTLDLTNLIPSNIKKDINIGGVVGTFDKIFGVGDIINANNLGIPKMNRLKSTTAYDGVVATQIVADPTNANRFFAPYSTGLGQYWGLLNSSISIYGGVSGSKPTKGIVDDGTCIIQLANNGTNTFLERISYERVLLQSVTISPVCDYAMALRISQDKTKIFFLGRSSTTFYIWCYNAATLAFIWKTAMPTTSSTKAVAVTATDLYVYQSSTVIVKLAISTGTLTTLTNGASDGIYSLIYYNGFLYAGCTQDNIKKLALDGTLLLTGYSAGTANFVQDFFPYKGRFIFGRGLDSVTLAMISGNQLNIADGSAWIESVDIATLNNNYQEGNGTTGTITAYKEEYTITA